MRESIKESSTMVNTLETALVTLIATLKNSFVYISGFILGVLLPIIPLIVVVGVLIMTDTIWGMVAAKRKGQWDKQGIYVLVSKMALYESLLIISFLFDRYIIGDIIALAVATVPLFITKIVASILGGIELWSINGNIYNATGFDFITRAKEALTRAKDIKDDINDFNKEENDTENKDNPQGGE